MKTFAQLVENIVLVTKEHISEAVGSDDHQDHWNNKGHEQMATKVHKQGHGFQNHELSYGDSNRSDKPTTFGVGERGQVAGKTIAISSRQIRHGLGLVPEIDRDGDYKAASGVGKKFHHDSITFPKGTGFVEHHLADDNGDTRFIHIHARHPEHGYVHIIEKLAK